MTTNQTIDGVPRELLIEAERIATGYGFPHIGQELRALLDAADHVHEWDINAEGTATVCHCGARSSDEPCEQLATTPTRTALIRGREKLIDERDYWKALAQKSAAQPQGEPVARITLNQVLKAYDYAESHPHKYLRGTTNWCAAVAHSLNVEQPVPVAVVLPERKHVPDFRQHPLLNKEYTGFNACLDEVIRLNAK
jgi:hypothetical protein